MTAILRTAGSCLAIDSSLHWVGDLIAEGSGGELEPAETHHASVVVQVQANRSAFATAGWEYLTRGAWRRHRELLIENACTSGFDLHVRWATDRAEFTYRWRPPARDRAAARVLRSRFQLLARAVLIQYPALWWAATRGRAPLHATACEAGSSTPLLAAAGGVGRSTLVLEELAAGGRATGDNIAVGDGTTVWGLVEPMRVEQGEGRRMPHGRRESPLLGRAHALEPDCVVVLRRGSSDEASLSACTAEAAAHSLVTSTYMAGELRRYWSFAATLAAGTRIGPPHPPLAEVAAAFSESLPCFLLRLGASARTRLPELLDTTKAATWA
jgi:hypothetical protein